MSRIALVGETEHDVREVMIEGVSGLLAVHPRTSGRSGCRRAGGCEWTNGAVAQAFSAEDPESLRGPQFAAAWCDELAKWRHAEATFDMLQFGLRLGERPRQVITTTPRPIALLKRLMADPATAVTRAATRANALHLAPAFLDNVIARYAGTRLGRQELDGEIIEERADALWSRALIESCRVERRRRCSASWSRSIRRPRGASAPTPAAWSRPARARTARLCARRRDGGGPLARAAGRRRRSRCGGGSRPTRWWSRSTRAATWCAR